MVRRGSGADGDCDADPKCSSSPTTSGPGNPFAPVVARIRPVPYRSCYLMCATTEGAWTESPQLACLFAWLTS